MRPELLIPILVPLGFFALIFGLVYMQKKESLAMIEKGFNPRIRGSKGPEPFTYLKWGLLLVGSGLGLLAAYFIDMSMTSRYGEEHPPLYFALIAIGGGVGLILSYNMEMKELKSGAFNSPASPSEL
ncbi:MAG: DUF6249 domain-containing protein [Flavitalea sp.]